MKAIIILSFIACVFSAFCINGLYEYSYTDRYSVYHDYRIRSQSTVMVLDINTEQLHSRKVSELMIGDYVLSHNGYFTHVKGIVLTNIEQPQLYYRYLKYTDDSCLSGTYAAVSIDIRPYYENIVFADSRLNTINNTINVVASNGIGCTINGTCDIQFGLYNYTDNIHYDMYENEYDNLMYYCRGMNTINMAVIVDYINKNNITNFTTQYSEQYHNVSAKIHPCEAAEIITESGSATVNGLFFFQ